MCDDSRSSLVIDCFDEPPRVWLQEFVFGYFFSAEDCHGHMWLVPRFPMGLSLFLKMVLTSDIIAPKAGRAVHAYACSTRLFFTQNLDI